MGYWTTVRFFIISWPALFQSMWRLTLVPFFYSPLWLCVILKKSTQQRNQGVWEAQRKWQYKGLNGIKGFVCDDEEKQQKQGGKAAGGEGESCLGTEWLLWVKSVRLSTGVQFLKGAELFFYIGHNTWNVHVGSQLRRPIIFLLTNFKLHGHFKLCF